MHTVQSQPHTISQQGQPQNEHLFPKAKAEQTQESLLLVVDSQVVVEAEHAAVTVGPTKPAFPEKALLFTLSGRNIVTRYFLLDQEISSYEHVTSKSPPAEAVTTTDLSSSK